MASITYLDSGTDSTQNLILYPTTSGTVTSSTANPRPGAGPRTLRCDSTGSNLAAFVASPAGVLADAGSRISAWYYTSALSASSPRILACLTSGGTECFGIYWKSTGVLGWVGSATQDCTTVLAAATWYRITVSYTITSTTVNSFKIYINGVLEKTITNATIPSIGTNTLRYGQNQAFGASKIIDVDDVYVDNGTDLLDPGNVWVTHKGYLGTSESAGNNGFDTFIGTTRALGSHYLNVSERPQSDTNGWDHAATGAAYEKYVIEAINVGDKNISGSIILGWQAWVRVKVAVAATMQLTDNGSDNAISATTTISQFYHYTTSATYPTGLFGVKSTGTTTDSFFYEGGVQIAYIPEGQPLSPQKMMQQTYIRM